MNEEKREDFLQLTKNDPLIIKKKGGKRGQDSDEDKEKQILSK